MFPNPLKCFSQRPRALELLPAPTPPSPSRDGQISARKYRPGLFIPAVFWQKTPDLLSPDPKPSPEARG